jgi:tetratricopeptide (TPR) repeat protein
VGYYAHFGLGLVALRRNMLDESESQFRRALDRQPEMVQAVLGIAQVNSIRGRTQEAIQGLRKALSLRPQDDSIALDLLRALAETRQQEEMVQLLKEHPKLVEIVKEIVKNEPSLGSLLSGL